MPLKGMTNTRRTPSHSHSLIGMALVAGLLLTACSHSSHDDENASEPTTTPSTTTVVLGDLDEKTGASILELLWELNAGRVTTLVLVTHDESLADRADRRVHLHAGRTEPGPALG